MKAYIFIDTRDKQYYNIGEIYYKQDEIFYIGLDHFSIRENKKDILLEVLILGVITKVGQCLFTDYIKIIKEVHKEEYIRTDEMREKDNKIFLKRIDKYKEGIQSIQETSFFL